MRLTPSAPFKFYVDYINNNPNAHVYCRLTVHGWDGTQLWYGGQQASNGTGHSIGAWTIPSSVVGYVVPECDLPAAYSGSYSSIVGWNLQ